MSLHREKFALGTSTPEDQGPSGGSSAKGGPGGAWDELHPIPTPEAPGAARRHDGPFPARPQAYATVTVKPSSPARLLKVGALVLISGAVLLLFGAIGAFYFWKGGDNHVSPERGVQAGVGVRGAGRGAGWRGLLGHPRVPPAQVALERPPHAS